jgi:hypothetical protein
MLFPEPPAAPVTLLTAPVVQTKEAPEGLLLNDIAVELPEQLVDVGETTTLGVGRITEESVA